MINYIKVNNKMFNLLNLPIKILFIASLISIFLFIFIIPTILIFLIFSLLLIFVCNGLNLIHNKLSNYILNIAFNHGYVKIHKLLSANDNIYDHLTMAIYKNNGKYIAEALKYFNNSNIYMIYKMLKTPDEKKYIIQYFLKNYSINLFFNQLHFEFNDIKKLIYNYYIKLLQL